MLKNTHRRRYLSTHVVGISHCYETVSFCTSTLFVNSSISSFVILGTCEAESDSGIRASQLLNCHDTISDFSGEFCDAVSNNTGSCSVSVQSCGTVTGDSGS